LVILERFEATRAVEAIEQFKISFMQLVPTMMQRIAKLDGVETRDFSSIEGCVHVGSPCPEWVKEKWIEFVRPERLYEIYGTTENIGATLITGNDWLEHRGSVGQPVSCEIKIMDLDGNEAPPGQVGEIFMRPASKEPTYEYLGSEPLESTLDGFTSAGDLGWLDDEGYLYIADRRTDMIISGGANVYPAEVEAVLNAHPRVGDTAVIGLPDPEWGRRVHALVEPLDYSSPPSPEELKQFCRQSLASYKAPRTYEYLERLPRDETGKIRRSQLVAARI
jgi:bile acid-coenzyme A ligase